MIYINGTGANVQLAGTVANQQLLDDGYTEYHGVIPEISEHQRYEFDGTNLAVVDDDESYAKDVSGKIQVLLDEQAKELRYDNMLSARALAGLVLPGTATATEIAMHVEAVKLAEWYLGCWGKATEIETDVINLIIPKPTVQEIIDQLPTYI